MWPERFSASFTKGNFALLERARTCTVPTDGLTICCMCGSPLLGSCPGMLLCHGPSWDIMKAYQVTSRVIGGAWVTKGLLILRLHHFLLELKTWRQKTGQRTEVYVMSRWCWFSAWWYHNDSNIPRKCKSNCLFSSCVNGNYIFIASKLVSKLQQWCRRDEVVEIKCRTNLNNSLLHSYLNQCSHENRFNDLNTALRMRTGSDGSD